MRISERRLRRIIRGMIRENIHVPKSEAEIFAEVIYKKYKSTINLDNIDEILAKEDLSISDFNDGQGAEEELRTALEKLIYDSM